MARRYGEFGASAKCQRLTFVVDEPSFMLTALSSQNEGVQNRIVSPRPRGRPTGAETPTKRRVKITAPEFVLVSPDLSPSVADVVEPLAAAGHITNVDSIEDREAQDVFEQLRGQVGEFFRQGLVGNSIYFGVPLSRYRRRHFYCLPRLPHV